jgi:DNA repair exonuclease SbcCD ATPase subunit
MYLNEKHNLNSGYSFIDRHIVSPGYNYFNQMISFDELVNNDILKVDLTENINKTSKEYKNLNEVISEIRGEEKEKLNKKLSEYSERATKAEVAIETLYEDNKKELIRIEKKYKDEIKNLKEKHKQIVDDFQEIEEKQISDLIETHKIKISDLKEAHLNEIETLKSTLKTVSEEFETYKGNKKQATLEEQITNLTKELEKYKKEVEANKNKKLIDRIFNK